MFAEALQTGNPSQAVPAKVCPILAAYDHRNGASRLRVPSGNQNGARIAI
jgi:hypothetical protein